MYVYTQYLVHVDVYLLRDFTELDEPSNDSWRARASHGNNVSWFAEAPADHDYYRARTDRYQVTDIRLVEFPSTQHNAVKQLLTVFHGEKLLRCCADVTWRDEGASLWRALEEVDI